MSTETEQKHKRPKDLTVGDEFISRGGPWSGLHVRVTGPPMQGRYGNYDVPVQILGSVKASLDYATDVVLLRPASTRGERGQDA